MLNLQLNDSLQESFKVKQLPKLFQRKQHQQALDQAQIKALIKLLIYMRNIPNLKENPILLKQICKKKETKEKVKRFQNQIIKF